MKLKKTILAISMLSAVWGGFFFLAPAPVAQAYGVGTQAERYPQMVTAAQFAQSMFLTLTTFFIIKTTSLE